MTAAPKEIRIGGRAMLVGALKIAEIGLLMRYIRDHSERPTERLAKELEFAPEEDHRKLRHEAWLEERDNWPPDPRSLKGAQILFGEPEGIKYFLSVLLGKYQQITDQQLDEIMAGLGEEGLLTLRLVAYGEDDLDPKAAWERARAFARAGGPQSPDPSPEAPPGDAPGTGNGATSSTTSTSSLPT